MAKKKSKSNGAKKQANGEVEKVKQESTEQKEVVETSYHEKEGDNDGTSGPEPVTQKEDDDSKQIQQLQKQVENLKQELSHKEDTLSKVTSEKDEQISKLETQLHEQSKEPTEDLELSDLRQQLAVKMEESNKYKASYDSLLSRLSQMKSVFNKMKEAESKFEAVESENGQLKSQLQSSNSKLSGLESNMSELKAEVLNLNSECDKLTAKNFEMKQKLDSQDFELENESKQLEVENRKLKRELKEAKSDLEEYLILIQEEKMSKTNLNQELSDVKSKMDTILRERKESEKKSQQASQEVTSLKETIVQLKKNSENVVNSFESQLKRKSVQFTEIVNEINELKESTAEKDAKLETLKGLENDLKEKQLLIGKLRHETIILNEHLKKAMKLIKRESGKETVDRELVSNLFISFLQIPRGDTKKFEVLRLIANFLNWDDEKKRHAGLISSANYRSNSNSVVEVPHPGRHASQSHGDSFVSLWTEFLEKESTPREDAV